ncbi:MAG: hypothetical protein ABMA64_15110 [Myxococcota bacterium]
MWSWLAAAYAESPDDLDRYLAARLDVVEAQVNTVYARAYDRKSGRFWFVVDQDGTPVDVVDFATRVGDPEVARRVRRARRGEAIGGIGLAVVGIGVGVVGLPFTAPIGGAGVLVGTWLAGRSATRHHPSAAYTEAEATALVQTYNRELREELLP